MAKIIIEPLPKNDPIFKNSFLTYGKKPIKKDVKTKEVKCPLKKVTLQEWQALGLPTEISTVHLGNTALTEKIKENHIKNEEEKGIVKKK